MTNSNSVMKRCLTSLAIMRMKIKPTVRYQYTSIRIDKKIMETSNACRMQRNWIIYILLLRV